MMGNSNLEVKNDVRMFLADLIKEDVAKMGPTSYKSNQGPQLIIPSEFRISGQRNQFPWRAPKGRRLKTNQLLCEQV